MSLVPIVADLLWHAQQPLRFGPIPLTTRMTVVRLRDGSLWIHSPIAPVPEVVDELRRLGIVRYVVAPNKSHHLFFLGFLAAFPQAEGFRAPGLELKRPDLGRFPLIPRDVAPWDADLRGYFIDGLRILNETVWFHDSTGTLILTDLLFCFSSSNHGITAFVAKLLGVHRKLAMSRTMKLVTDDRRALARSVAPLLGLPVQRIVVAHDQIVDHAAAAQLDAAFNWLR